MHFMEGNPNVDLLKIGLNPDEARAHRSFLEGRLSGPHGTSTTHNQWIEEVAGRLILHGNRTANGHRHPYRVVCTKDSHWEDGGGLYSLHDLDPYTWATELRGVTGPALYRAAQGSTMVLTADATPVFGVQHSRIPLRAELLAHSRNTDPALLTTAETTTIPLIDATLQQAMQDHQLSVPTSRRENIFNHLYPHPLRDPDDPDRMAWYTTDVTTPAWEAATRALEALAPHIVTRPNQRWAINKTGYVWARIGCPMQMCHADINPIVLPDPDIPMYTLFSPVSNDIPNDKVCGSWVVGSRGGLPDPWVEEPIALQRGQVLVLDSRLLHRGGGGSTRCHNGAVHVVLRSGGCEV